MSDEILKEIQVLKESMVAISERIRKLEQRVRSPEAEPAAAPAPVRPKAAAAVPVKPAAPHAAAPAEAERESLETKIGRDWLNRIGIVSLVIGVAFFILYSFQYLGPVAKIGIGFGIGAGLLGLGWRLERKAHLGLFARGLLGGGWAVIYFTTYAMHHIPAVRLLPNAFVDLLLLLGVAGGAISHALSYRSQAITALAFLLGFVTTAISTVTYFTLASSALLAISLIAVAVRMRWHGLLLFGVLGSYLTHLFWIAGQIAMSPMIAIHVPSAAASQFWLEAGFLGLYWLAFTLATFAFDQRDTTQRNALLSVTIANGLLFITQFFRVLEPVYPKAQFWALLGLGVVYVLLGLAGKKRGLLAIANTDLLFGLTLMTLSVPERLTDRWTSFFWIMEIASLTWVGLRYNRWAYRLFAFGLAVLALGRLLTMDFLTSELLPVFGHPIPWRVLIGVVAIASFGATATCYRLPRFRSHHRSAEPQAFHLYLIAACFVAWTLTMVEANREFVALLWAAEASALVGLGWWLKDRAVRMMGLAWFGTVCLSVLVEVLMHPSWWSVPATSGVVGFLYAMAILYRREVPDGRFDVEGLLRHWYAVAASVILTALLWLEVSSQWLSLALAVEGLGLVATGFWLRDRVFRITGLVVFSLLVLRILLVDLAGAETIYRILSFIVAGAILLMASLAYATFSKRGATASGSPNRAG